MKQAIPTGNLDPVYPRASARKVDIWIPGDSGSLDFRRAVPENMGLEFLTKQNEHRYIAMNGQKASVKPLGVIKELSAKSRNSADPLMDIVKKLVEMSRPAFADWTGLPTETTYGFTANPVGKVDSSGRPVFNVEFFHIHYYVPAPKSVAPTRQ